MDAKQVLYNSDLSNLILSYLLIEPKFYANKQYNEHYLNNTEQQLLNVLDFIKLIKINKNSINILWYDTRALNIINTNNILNFTLDKYRVHYGGLFINILCALLPNLHTLILEGMNPIYIRDLKNKKTLQKLNIICTDEYLLNN